MKTSFILTLVIVAAGSFWGVRETRYLTTLREKHRLVLKEAAALGVSTDASNSAVTTKASRREREDSNRKVKDFANVLVAFAKEMKEMEKSGKQPYEAMQKRIMELMDGMLSLNGDELKILIDELRGRSDMDDEMREGMISFSIIMLSQKHPQAGLALFTESSDLLGDNPMSKHALSSALSQWAKDQPLEALKWIQENAGKHPDLANDEAKAAVIAGAAQNSIGLALQLIGELKLSPDESGVMGRIARAADTPEQQTEFLTELRKQADGKEGKEIISSGLRALFSQMSESGYDKTMAWVETAGLSADESGKLAQSLNYFQTKGDTGKWLDWMSSQSMDEGKLENTTGNLVRQWTQKDYQAAGEWLAQAPAGPVKESATISYLETVAPYEPDAAAQWAATLPAAKQKDALQGIYQTLRQKDKAAAEAFAAEHGVDVKP
jgi:hypothetical protein